MNIHKPWIVAAVSAGLAKFSDATVKINDVPEKGKSVEVPFQKVEFCVTDDAGLTKLWKLAEDSRETTKDKDGNEVKAENPLNTLLGYAYGLNCRSKVRIQYESQFVDPEAGVKKLAALLVKMGKFKDLDKAMAAAKLLQESESEE